MESFLIIMRVGRDCQARRTKVRFIHHREGQYHTPHTGPKRPTLLIRSPYGRRGLIGVLSALPYVGQGYQVLIQSCRGTAGSGGTFAYARNEHDDGLATIAWIKQQEWFSGELATVGGSYLGFVQWAVAAEA